MRDRPSHYLPRRAVITLAALSVVADANARALPNIKVAPAPELLRVQDLCGTIGNCGIGHGGINTIPRNTITPDIGRFEPGHDNRFGRYRYEAPDQQLDLNVDRIRPTPRVTSPRYSGPRTIYRVEKLSAEHVDWCYGKFRSYRARDNTYQPDKGVRKVCVSPF